jgi:hypothetical protein
MILNDLKFYFDGHFENEISNKILIFNMILKISKSSQNDLKSDFVKLSIKSLNTLPVHLREADRHDTTGVGPGCVDEDGLL